MALTNLSPAGQILGLDGGTVETEEQKRRRLAALQNTRANIGSSLSNSNLSPAAQYLNLGLGGGLGLGGAT